MKIKQLFNLFNFPHTWKVVTIIGAISVTSCLRLDQIEELNSEPILTINGQSSTVADSMKLSASSNYSLELNAIDPDNNLKSISFETFTGDGNLIQNGSPINEIQLDNGHEIISISYRPNRTGNHVLVFTAQDVFGRESAINFDLFVFDNLGPIAQFELVKPEVQHDPLEYQIDASFSYDPDVKFGGGIVAYEYTFLGKTVELSSSALGIIFPETGIYDIGIRVKDNDGEWSDIEIRSFQIN